MTEHDNRFGKFEDDGSVSEPEVSILTGSPIAKVGAVTERIVGTPYFYRFEGAFEHLVTGQLRQQWHDSAPSGRGRPVIAAKKTDQTETPDK